MKTIMLVQKLVLGNYFQVEIQVNVFAKEVFQI